jgi:ABC-type Zn2+ transport system substrate-binding protein/surface adhesin
LFLLELFNFHLQTKMDGLFLFLVGMVSNRLLLLIGDGSLAIVLLRDTRKQEEEHTGEEQTEGDRHAVDAGRRNHSNHKGQAHLMNLWLNNHTSPNNPLALIRNLFSH